MTVKLVSLTGDPEIEIKSKSTGHVWEGLVKHLGAEGLTSRWVSVDDVEELDQKLKDSISKSSHPGYVLKTTKDYGETVDYWVVVDEASS